MVEHRTEALVVVADPQRYDDVISELGRTVTVTQRLPPRLALVAVGEHPEPPDVSGVRWFADEVPATTTERLTPRERLFVAAWQSRRAGKDRPGDGLAWDAPGYLPPDMPPHGER